MLNNEIENYFRVLENNFPYGSFLLKIILISFLAWLGNFIVKRVFMRALMSFIKKSKNSWDDIVFKHKVFYNIAKIVPAAIIFNFAFLLPILETTIEKLTISYMIIVLNIALSSFLNAINEIYETVELSKVKSIKSFIQIIKILAIVVCVILVATVILGKSPLALLGGIGAMTAVIMLIFKDTILSFVASIQITFTDIVKIGDWITMSNFGADGDVIDISLYTVTVQNFDKTIVTIPTSKIIDNSFKNWRGMSESGARRIKRSINIDINSVNFLKSNEVENLKKIDLIKDYLENKVLENSNVKLTNIGVFRIYVVNYLKSLSTIDKSKTLLVRHLQPTSEGLPLEIYSFANDNRWANYEDIQSDIFDHLLATITQFGLKVFQAPSGKDIELLKSRF
ncbi:MAG: mechanosensitive ion channel protein MscS [Candidatus Cloacimonadota bacterium]|nr:MAG: mechanosensitive ion channel protein MscS [Candidatus Cloacimonadota bacterium]PIE77920.1 MAG: mechanosensitive ion channel protein MscS [Candidatus Delongbacteria bacterium]